MCCHVSPAGRPCWLAMPQRERDHRDTMHISVTPHTSHLLRLSLHWATHPAVQLRAHSCRVTCLGVLKLCPGVLPEIPEIPPSQRLEEKISDLPTVQIISARNRLVLTEQFPLGKQVTLSFIQSLLLHSSFIHSFVCSFIHVTFVEHL